MMMTRSTRQLARPLILVLALLVLAVAISRPHAAQGAPTATQQFRGNAGHAPDTTFPAAFNTDNITSAFTYDPSIADGLPGGFNSGSQPCVSADSSMVFAVGELDTVSSKIIAINTTDGGKLWEITVPSHNAFGSSSSPVYSRGYVYWIGSDGAGTTSAYKIHAPSGTTSAANGGWQVTLPITFDIVNATPMIADCLMFFDSYADFVGGPTTAIHVALRLSDGGIAWANPDGGQGQGSPAFVPASHYIVTTIYDPVAAKQRLRAYHSTTGNTAWTTPFTLGASGFEVACVHHNGSIYVQDTNFGNGSLYRIDAATGALIWQAAIPLSGTGAPAIDDAGNVYCCGEDFGGTNRVFAFDSAGVEIAAWDGTGSGGNSASVTVADGMVLVGHPGSSSLRVLDAADGSLISSLAGFGPVAFGRNRIYSIDTNGVLQANTCGSLFASSVVTYTQGSTSTPTYNDSDTALGRPATTTVGTVGGPPPQIPVVPSYPPVQTDQIVSIGVGGELVLRFDQHIDDDPNNPHGIDFIVFGNALMGASGNAWDDEEDPTGFTLDGSIFQEPGTVEVSQDGTTWVAFASPSADTFAPTFGRVYDTGSPDAALGVWNLWWSATDTNANLPLDPSLTAAGFNGMTVAQMAQTFGQSAGGTGFD
ncbi:MAG: PQQ-binding-like beta-propeller repeat protein, partial [Planctomycetota bacterium]